MKLNLFVLEIRLKREFLLYTHNAGALFSHYIFIGEISLSDLCRKGGFERKKTLNDLFCNTACLSFVWNLVGYFLEPFLFYFQIQQLILYTG